MKDKIVLDVDKDRIRTILGETYKTVEDVLMVSPDISLEEFVSQVDKYLDSNRITNIPVYLDLPTPMFPGMKIEVNIRRAKVFARIPSRRRFHKKQALLNRYLKVL